MKNLLEVLRESAPKLRVLNIAKNGSGKTYLGLTFPDPIYVFDYDNRIFGGLKRAIERKKHVDYDTYMPEDPTSFDAGIAKLDEFIRLVTTGKFPYQTVMLDTITSLSDAAMVRGMPVGKSFYRPTRPVIGTVEVPVQSDYQVQGAMLKRWIEKLLLLPCHIVVNGHEYEKKDKVGTLLEIQLAAPGQQRGTLPGRFNELWRMETDVKSVPAPSGIGTVQQTIYYLVTRSDNLHSARTCYDGALAPREEPDFDVIYPKITGWIAQKRKELGLEDATC